VIFLIFEVIIFVLVATFWFLLYSREKHRDSQWNAENDVEREQYFHRNHQV
jgi:heme/copper-type cytochrome/quinol oxidase subunit 2